MTNRLKNILFDHFMSVIEFDVTIGLTNAQKRAVANKLALNSTLPFDENLKKCNELYNELVLKHEKNRKQFIGMINFIEKNTKILLDSMKTQGLIKIEHDALKRKSVLKARSSVLEQNAQFLNSLNDLVIKFYEDVYEIEKVSDKDAQKDNIQGSLF